jgi:hypothetical protein
MGSRQWGAGLGAGRQARRARPQATGKKTGGNMRRMLLTAAMCRLTKHDCSTDNDQHGANVQECAVHAQRG